MGSKRTENIKAGFFLPKERIEAADMELEHCLVELMWNDMHIKPKQETHFCLNWSMVVSIPVEYDDEY